MANLIFNSNGEAVEFSLPDGYSADYVAIIPQNSRGKITLCRNIDFSVQNGVIRFLRHIPKNTEIIISNDINDLITADVESDFNDEIQVINSMSETVQDNRNKINSLIAAQTNVLNESASIDYLSEASINNSLMIADLYERTRQLKAGEI